MNLQEHLASIGACREARKWCEKHATTAREAWAKCDNPQWGIWWVAQVHGWKAIDPVIRRAVLRATRGYAAAAMDKANLPEHAARLRALASDATFAEIRSAAYAAYAATADATAAYAAAYAAYAANAANAAAYAAYDACEKEREWQSDRLLELLRSAS